MSKRSLLITTILIFVLSLAFGVGSASAASVSFGGTIAPGDPVMDVVFITSPNCTGQGSGDVLYHLYPFTVDVSGTYDFSLTSPGGFASIYLFQGSFDPANGFPTCIAGDNSGNPVDFSEALTAGTQYYFVPFDDTFVQAGGSYSATISGPGNIYVTGLGSDCPYPLPVGSVVYNIPAGAPAFFAADLGSGTGFNIPAGTWYVSEFSGDFAKVWIACQASPVWVPANAVGGPVG